MILARGGKRGRRPAALLGIVAGGAIALSGSAPLIAANPTVLAVPVDCDRACLTGQIGAVLAAMVSHDLSALPLSPSVRTTENGVAMPLFDGLWQTAGGLGRYRLDAIDPESGQAGTLAVVMEDGKPVYTAIRIRVREQKIDEIEVLAARGGIGNGPTAGVAMERRGAPRAQFLRTVPERDRMRREDLVRVADAYFANLQASTGRSSAPFAKTCNRIENGTQTTNVTAPRTGREGFDVLQLGCEAQQRSGFYPFVTSIRDRRFPIVDRERGLVLAFGYFDHTGTVGDMKLTNGMTVQAPFRTPLTFAIAELFQIDRGKIDQVEAALVTVPYRMRADHWDRPD
jgi:hypothetical protein